MDTIERVNLLASELDRLKITNIAKRCKDRRIANDMSVIIECWLKCSIKLDTHRLLITRASFTSSIALYTELMRVIAPFNLDDMSRFIDEYVQHYKSLKEMVICWD